MCNAPHNLAVGYLRVSTKQQGDSGLGLEAQQRAINAHCQTAAMVISKTFTEIESGKLAERPQLAAALAHCKRTGARLVVAKLDRLARNVHFLSGLMESGVKFTACDSPHANELTIHILAAVAQAEAKAISVRTKEALASAKARGMLLGSARPGHWTGREQSRIDGLAKGRRITARRKRERAIAAVADLVPIMREARQNHWTLRQIAERLNSDGHTTARGNHWTAKSVLAKIRVPGAGFKFTSCPWRITNTNPQPTETHSPQLPTAMPAIHSEKSGLQSHSDSPLAPPERAGLPLMPA